MTATTAPSAHTPTPGVYVDHRLATMRLTHALVDLPGVREVAHVATGGGGEAVEVRLATGGVVVVTNHGGQFAAPVDAEDGWLVGLYYDADAVLYGEHSALLEVPAGQTDVAEALQAVLDVAAGA